MITIAIADCWRKRTMSQSGWHSSICWSKRKPKTGFRSKSSAPRFLGSGCKAAPKPASQIAEVIAGGETAPPARAFSSEVARGSRIENASKQKAGVVSALADFLRKGIAQTDGPVEHRRSRRRIAVADKIALPLELHDVA